MTTASRAEATIKQLCSLGLPSEAVMPMLAEELLAAVPSGGVTFLWADPAGGLANCFDPHPDAGRVTEIFVDRFYGPREFGPGFRETMHRGWGVKSMEQVYGARLDEFLASDQFNLIHRPLGHGRHIFLVVRTPASPIGLAYLMIHRGLDERAFSAEDRFRLASLEPFLGHLLSAGASAGFPLADDTSTGLIVATVDGKPIHVSPEGRRLLDLAASPGSSGKRPAALPPAIAGLATNLSAALAGDNPNRAPAYHHRNACGGFTFTAHRLDSTDEAAGLVGIVITYREPRAIALMRGIRKLPLSRRQSEVCRLLAEGHTHAEIARLLGISKHTAIAHARWIYDKLAVHDRTALVARLLADKDRRPSLN